MEPGKNNNNTTNIEVFIHITFLDSLLRVARMVQVNWFAVSCKAEVTDCNLVGKREQELTPLCLKMPGENQNFFLLINN